MPRVASLRAATPSAISASAAGNQKTSANAIFVPVSRMSSEPGATAAPSSVTGSAAAITHQRATTSPSAPLSAASGANFHPSHEVESRPIDRAA